MMELVLTILGYCLALLVAGAIVWLIAKGLNHGPEWVRSLIVLALLSLLVIGPICGIIYGLFFAGPQAPYSDQPYSGSDRYN